jgi:hypothetical protein
MVPIIEIDVTPSQLMAGHGRVAAPALTGGPVGSTPALAAAGPDYVALAAEVTDAEGIRDLWRQANGAGHMTQGLNDHLAKRAAEIEAQTPGGMARVRERFGPLPPRTPRTPMVWSTPSSSPTTRTPTPCGSGSSPSAVRGA